MRSRLIPAALLVSALLPVVASAAAWQRLKDDVSAWDTDATLDEAEQTDQLSDQAFQQSDELFPAVQSSSAGSKSALEQSREQRIKDFVSIETPRGLLIFTDVPRTAWFASYVRFIAEARLINGYADAAGNPLGKFGPDDNVTVEQMAKVLVSALGVLPTDCPTTTLNLSSSGSWSVPYVSCAEQRQWALFAGNSVDVHRPATRAEVVVTLLQAYGIDPSAESGSLFTDVSPTLFYTGYIARAKKDNIISGYADANGVPTGLFGPDDPVTRAAFAKVVTGAMQKYKLPSSSSSSMMSAASSSSSSK